MLVSENGSPTVYFETSATTSCFASSYFDSGTSMRVWAAQVCPEFRKQALTVPLIAAARSASSRMIEALFPPSSSATRLTDRAASSETRFPARVEPVKEIMSTSG